MRAPTAKVEIHHILVDGIPICKLTEPWAKFFTCYYQWEPTAKQAADRISALPTNKGKKVEVIRGKCICGK